jgi:cytochrome c biogenesis protein CcmG/thiol:disulfide interchange protein DsbE
MRRVLVLLAAAGLVALVVVGLGQAERDEPSGAAAGTGFDLERAKQRLAGAPAPLAALHAQSNELLPGGAGAFQARLRALRGHPVVVNKWASWCGPCRNEFPLLEQLATERGKTVAFLGVNVRDKDPAAREFLARRPLPYPSYTDPDEKIGRALETPALYPVTVFIDARGKRFTHVGEYRTAADLAADIDRYAAP